jgi:single-stranded-DNA-specific exonuclease
VADALGPQTARRTGSRRGELDRRWVVAAEACEASQALGRELGISEPIARLLVSRGIATAESARAHLQPTLGLLHDPYLMLGMDIAVARLRLALSRQEPVLIYGDYDVDGTVATVLLKTALERAAAAMNVTADIRYHIPHRIRDGYGMQDARIESAAAEGVRLVVSVDTGIREFAAAAEAKRLGIDLIVTDHHLPAGSEGVPHAVAVLNPNQPGCGYPYKELCGAGVVFKLSQALLESTVSNDAERARLREKTLPSFLKLLSIATIADAVPLTGENRTIAWLGLQELRRPVQVGLKTLMELAQIDITRPVSATDVGFRIAPRINAAGRMDIASDVVTMFSTRDDGEARAMAAKLHRLNDERRATEAEALRRIEAQIAAMGKDLPACFVLDDADGGAAWHRGVIGILASRVVDRTGVPAVVVTHEGGYAYGSGRSVGGFHLLDALTAAHQRDSKPLLLRFGGHAFAVGFTMQSELVQELRERLGELAAVARRNAPVVEDLRCDAELQLSELTPEFLSAMERLGPFGRSNAEPFFLSRNVRLTAPVKVVSDKHLRLSVEDDSGARFGAMAWSRRTNWVEVARSAAWTQGDRLDIAYRLQRNWFRGADGWELEVVAMRPAEPLDVDDCVLWEPCKSIDS